ncbi:MAG: glycosyltransferase family 39 protein [Pirellulales bacterium]|nr:glycosyltransferase family 39 protein [Pirellulales bacterium]
MLRSMGRRGGADFCALASTIGPPRADHSDRPSGVPAKSPPAPRFDAASQPTSSDVRWTKVIVGFCLLHLLVWTLIPTLTQPNLPVDAIEMSFWGREWELGYHKHPPLPAWEAQFMLTATNYSPWSLYLMAQISIVACFFAVWRLAREVAVPGVAAASVVLLESVYYYTFTSTELNHNVVLMPAWAWSVTLFYLALTQQRWHYWLLTGFAVGLGLLTKYSVGFLLIPMTLFFFLRREGRQTLATPGPWLALAVALAIFAPHGWWMWDRDFMSIRYALGRADDGSELSDHLLNPLRFLLGQAGAAVPLLIGCCGLLGWPWRKRSPLAPSQRFARDYLAAMVLGPLVMHVAIACLFGMQMRSMWGAPLWSFAALALFVSYEVQPTRKALRDVFAWSVLAGGVFVAGTLVRNGLGPYATDKASRVHFAGDELAEQIEREWHERYARPLELVAGDWWLAGNVSFYGNEHARVYGSFAPGSFDLPAEFNPWTDDSELARTGGVILWDARSWGDELRDALRKRFPQARVAAPLVLDPATCADVAPARVGVAFIPPADARE